jgi:hypothetical protein
MANLLLKGLDARPKVDRLEAGRWVDDPRRPDAAMGDAIVRPISSICDRFIVRRRQRPEPDRLSGYLFKRRRHPAAKHPRGMGFKRHVARRQFVGTNVSVGSNVAETVMPDDAVCPLLIPITTTRISASMIC